MNLPYITEYKGVGGRIKDSCEDFIVKEIPVYGCCGSGEHVYVNITKKGLTTKEVHRKICDEFGLKERDVGFAGLKDKNAVTTQTFSLLLRDADKEKVKNKVGGFGVKVNWVDFHKNKLKKGHLLGNKFIIFIRDIVNKENIEKIAKKLKEVGVPNFYGSQRFGMYGDNASEGLKIIKGKKKIKDRWLKRFLVSSYQSYLFNEYLKLRIEKGMFGKLLIGDIAKKHDTGGLFNVEEDEQERFDNKEISFTGPIYGKKMWEAGDRADELEKEVLEKEDVDLGELSRYVNGSRRIGRILVDDLSYEIIGNDVRLEFSLPKGSFATIVLREFMESE